MYPWIHLFAQEFLTKLSFIVYLYYPINGLYLYIFFPLFAKATEMLQLVVDLPIPPFP